MENELREREGERVKEKEGGYGMDIIEVDDGDVVAVDDDDDDNDNNNNIIWLERVLRRRRKEDDDGNDGGDSAFFKAIESQLSSSQSSYSSRPRHPLRVHLRARIIMSTKPKVEFRLKYKKVKSHHHHHQHHHIITTKRDVE